MSSAPGEVRAAEKGTRTLYLTVGIWQDRGGVHLSLPGWIGFHVNVTAKNHPKLFSLLKDVLQFHGRWS